MTGSVSEDGGTAAALPDIAWLPGAVLLITRTGDCVAASSGAADMLHIPRDGLLEAGWIARFRNAEQNIRWIASMTSADGGSPALDLQSASTPRRSFRLSFKPLPGRADILSVCLTDTTLERASDAASLQYKQLLDRVQTLSDTGYWRYDVATGQVAWSDRVYEIHGIPPGSGPVDIDTAIAAYHPEDRPQAIELLQKTLSTGEPFEWKLRIIRKDGSIRNVVGKGELDGSVNSPTKRLFGVFRDITEECEKAQASQITQERLSLVVQASRDGVWDWRFGSDEVFYSDRFKEILGITTPGNTMSVERAKSLIHRDDIDAYSKLVREHLAGNQRCDAEIRLLRTDGSYRWVEIKAVASFDETGGASRIVGTVGDITARKQADEVLRQARHDALEASAAKSEFVATVSHELRTPLNGVIGMLDLLSNANLNDEQASMAETATDSARSLLAILDDLLDFSKLDANRIELNPVPFNAREHMNSVLTLFAPAAAKQHIGLSVTAADDLPEVLVADQIRLRQVLANLVGNAVKFTREGSVRLHAAPAVGPDGQNQIRYSVTDTGIGIAADEQEKLFQPYSQAGNNTFETFGGTGLGLAICKQLAECMGGSIGVESTPGSGSTFWFTINAEVGSAHPAQAGSAGELAGEAPAPTGLPAVAASDADRATGTTAPTTKPHLLIAEDNVVNQRVITAMVSRLGYTFDVVEDGVEAVEAVRAKSYDAVLMDIQMPRLDGVMATRLIREEERDSGRRVPIVAITAHAMRGTREDYVAAGMTDFIAKPIEVKTLAVTLMRLCKSDGAAAPDDNSNPAAATGA